MPPPSSPPAGAVVAPAVAGAGPGLAARWFHHLAEAERQRFAPWLAVALGSGVLVYFALPSEPPAGAAWVAPPLVLLAVLVGMARPAAGYALGLAAAAAVALGFAVALWHAGRQPPPLDLPRGAAVVSGRVADVDLLPEGRRVTLTAPRLDGGEALPRLLRVRLRNEDPARPEPGEVLTVRALVRAPVTPAYPGAYDFQWAAFFSGLGGSGFASGRATVEPGTEGAPLAGLRAAIEARATAALPGAAGAIAAALLTGGQSAIPATDLAAMRELGPGAPAVGVGVAHRHRHGRGLRGAARRDRRRAADRPARAGQAGGSSRRIGRRCVLHAADRRRRADAAELRRGRAEAVRKFVGFCRPNQSSDSKRFCFARVSDVLHVLAPLR